MNPSGMYSRLGPRRGTRLLIAGTIAAGVLSGCATFKGSRSIDVGPFAENTLGMIGELQKFNRPVTWTRLRKYSQLPSVLETRQAVEPIRRLMRGVGLYSSQLVSLYESPLSESRKISELARYVEEYIRPGLAQADTGDIQLTQSDLDVMVRDIRSRETLLSALGAVQPLVSATMAHGVQLFDQLDRKIQAAAADIGTRVEEEYGPLKSRIEELTLLHLASVRSYGLLQRYRDGEKAALDSLRASDPGLQEFLPSGRAPSVKELDAAERYVLERTSTLRSLRDQLEPDFQVYRECQLELDALRAQSDEHARLARVTLMIWGRSHRNLAAGIQVPPMIDVLGMMKSTVSTGASHLVP